MESCPTFRTGDRLPLVQYLLLIFFISAPLIKGIQVIAPPSHEQFELKVEDYVTAYVEKVKTKQKEKLPEDQEEEQEAVQAAG